MGEWRLRVTDTAAGYYWHARGKVMDTPFATKEDAETVRRLMPE